MERTPQIKGGRKDGPSVDRQVAHAEEGPTGEKKSHHLSYVADLGSGVGGGRSGSWIPASKLCKMLSFPEGPSHLDKKGHRMGHHEDACHLAINL
jgi:hypothetical protein